MRWFRKLEERLTVDELRLETYGDMIANLAAEVAHLKAQSTALEGKVEELQTNSAALKDEVNALQTQNTAIKTEVEELRKSLNSQTDELSEQLSKAWENSVSKITGFDPFVGIGSAGLKTGG